MDPLNQLHELLDSYNRDPGSGTQDLYYELIAGQPILRRLFDVPQRNSGERSQLQSGKATVSGQTLVINESFAAEALFLSDCLDVSELYCAEVLEVLTRTDPNRPATERLEKAINLYHARRNSVIVALNQIVDGASQEELTGQGDLLKSFAVTQLFRGEPLNLNNGRRGGFSEKIMEEIDRVGSLVGKVTLMIRDARSETDLKNKTLGRYVLESRLRLLKSERIQLASLLYRASDQRLISALDVTKLIQWISEAATSDVSPYIICATLSSINPRNHNGDGPLTLVGDPNFVRFANQQLGSSAVWRAPNSRSTKALLDLAWSLFRLWHSNSESHGLFSEDELETDMRKAIESDAFRRLLLLVIQAETSEAKFGQDPLSYAAALRQESPELSDSQYSSYREPVEDSFKPLMLKTAEDLVTDLIASAAPVLKSLRTRQEDLLGANTRTRVASNAPPKQKPRNDTAVFFSLLGTLYTSLPPDSALHFWVASDVNKSMFPKLLRWASDAHEKSTVRALFEMISGLSHGKRCSEEAYNFLSSAAGGDGDRNYGGGPPPLLSWRFIFRMLDNLKTKIPDPRLPSQSRNQDLRVGHGQASPSITPEEVYQLNGCLTVLRTVAAHSTRARMALFKHSSFKLIPTLVSMIPRHVPLELKGSIFNTLVAFCIAGAGAQGVELCKNIWSHLEEVEVIGAQHNKAMFGGGGEIDSGVAFELEEIEIPAKRYPSSLSFIRLLGCLIHAPKAIPLSKRMLQYEPTGTVPDNLGAPRRAPGVLPYTRFIIDKIILPTLNGSREYSDIDDKWEMLDASFAYLENCLASYSMEDLYQPEIRDNTLGAQSLMGRYFTHPGFGVLHELLTDSPLIHAMLAYVHQGTLHMESQTSNSSLINPLFQNTMLRVMRIIHRVLDIQTPFLEVFAPVAAELDTKSILGSQFSVSLLTGLDQRLVWSPDRVVSIALCAVYGRQSELVLMSIRTLSALAGSPSWLSTNQTSSLSSRRHINRLAVALDRNAESDNILSAFVRILNREVSEEITEAELDFITGAGAPIQGSSTSFDGALRWEVLDLLLENTNGSRPGPNLAHLLLGFSQEGVELMLEDPHAVGARVSCLHVVLRHLRRGIKGQLSDRSAHDQHLRPLYQSNTTFAEKCYRLIYQLCTQDITRDTTMRYLRNQENFFVRQLANMPAIVPTTLVTGSPGIISYADQSQVATTCETITAFLRLRSYLLEVVAQEIHLLTQSGQRRNVQELMNILFTSSNLSGESVTEGMNSLLGSRFSSRQSLDTIIELFMSFDFEWQEGQEVEQVDLAFYHSVNLLAALRPDPAGCELIDREVLMQILFNAKTQVQNELTSTTALTQLERETAYILSSCTVENHRREIQHAKGFGLESWRRLLEVCLAKCFEQLSLERRESLLCDLLLALPSVIGSGSVSAFGMTALSETVLTLMTKLREERTKYTDSPYDFGVPSEKLISIFKKILECVLDPNAPELVRGNLYASLISYFHMINPNTPKSNVTNYEAFSDSVSLDNSFSRSVNDNVVLAEPGLLKQSVYTVNMVVDKLVQVIGRDAIDGSELWRSVAFSVLDCLTRLSRREKQHRVLAALVKQGILHTFIASVSELDADLEMIYSADPVDLNSLFVYESKMSLLIRIAQTRQGAEKLLDHRAFEILGRCSFISTKPELDQMSQIDRATFLPNTLQRYHQLLTPALQLANSILSSVSLSSKQSMKQVFNFIMSHRESFILLLKDSNSETSLPMLKEQRLIVSLYTYILPALQSDELNQADFAPLHAAILTLAAKCLCPKPRLSIRPFHDTELEADSNTFEFDGGRTTRFELIAQEAFEVLKTTLVGYLASASNTNGSEFRCVLSPHAAVSDEEQASALTLQPSIGDITSALNRNLSVLGDVLRQIDNISHKLASPESISNEDIAKLTQTLDPVARQGLTGGQLRGLALNEMSRGWSESSGRALRYMYTIEVMMLLIWRHMNYFQSGRYLEDQFRSSKGLLLKSRLATSQNLVASQSRPLSPTMGPALMSILNIVESISLPLTIFGKDTNSRESYLQVLCRKLKETIELGQELDGERSFGEDGL